MKIDQREYSPNVIDQIVFAGGSNHSAKKAARQLLKLARLQISGMEVLRITEQIGDELLAQRERDARLQQRRELPSANELPVDIACVETDGGRMLTRAAGKGRGVHERGWKETKVAALGDGDHKNWIVHKLHFPDFIPITDFVHPVTYLYDAASAVTSSWAAHWEQYTSWMTACWQGRSGHGRKPGDWPGHRAGSRRTRCLRLCHGSQRHTGRILPPRYRRRNCR